MTADPVEPRSSLCHGGGFGAVVVVVGGSGTVVEVTGAVVVGVVATGIVVVCSVPGLFATFVAEQAETKRATRTAQASGAAIFCMSEYASSVAGTG
jgi:aspartokinase-like uncharacterized kinase